MADTTVKYFDSTQIGAPVLNGVAGALIALFDACLVNGFGVGTPDSVVIAGGVCTVTRAAGHPMQVGTVALLAGCVTTGAGSLNGEQKVTAVTTTTYAFATTVTNQSATGTITHKTSPAGWTKLFTGTNLAVYQSPNVAATKMCLRVDDTGTTEARVVGYESMTDVNTGVNAFPTSSQVSGGLFWTKSSAANATANAWMLVADSRTIYTSRAYRSGNVTTDQIVAHQTHMFGDIVPTKSGDAYGAIISGEIASQAASTVGGTTNGMTYNSTAAGAGLYMTRAYTGIGTANPTGRAGPVFNGVPNNANSGTLALGTPFPNPTDGGLYVTQQYIFDAQNGTSNDVHRGYSPGFYVSPQLLPPGSFNARDMITGVAGLPGKTLRAVLCQTNTPGGAAFFDTTGPWH